jgi:hypothetical protein
MHPSHTAIGVAVAAVLIGCNQPDLPTSPTSDHLLRGPSVAASAGAINAALSAEVVPFKGRLEGAFTVTFDTPPSPFFTVLLEATGNASLLGRFTMEAPHRVNAGTGGAIGTFVFTAANGDMLTADFTGASGPTATPGVYAIVETATITGGTGRFAGATGGFVVERLVNLDTGLTSGSFDGTISSPGAAKR